MSFGGGASAPSQPKLKKVDIASAEDLAVQQDLKSIGLSEADWGQRFPAFPVARDFMITDAGRQLGGAVSPQADFALRTAGLGDEANRIAGGNEFETAQNLGVDIVAKESRDRNFAQNLLQQFQPKPVGLSGSDAVRILEANTGGANSFNQAAFGTATNSYNAGLAQQAQAFSGIASLASSLVGAIGKGFTSHYTDPYSSIYSANPGSFGQSYAPTDTGVGYDLPGGYYGG